jgi:hypothetical protein
VRHGQLADCLRLCAALCCSSDGEQPRGRWRRWSASRPSRWSDCSISRDCRSCSTSLHCQPSSNCLLSPLPQRPADSDSLSVSLPPRSLFQTSGKLMMEHEEVADSRCFRHCRLLPSAAAGCF